MRKVLEVLLALAAMSALWFVLEFAIGPLYAFFVIVPLGLEQAFGRAAAGAIAGALAGVGIGLAPGWARWGFWLGAAAGAALGAGLERATGFLHGQWSLGAFWAALSLASFTGPAVEGIAQSPPEAACVRPLRLALAVVLAAAAGLALTPRGGESGPVALRIVFALGHVLLCCFLRHPSGPAGTAGGPGLIARITRR